MTCEFLSDLVTFHHCADELRGIRIRNWNNLIIAQININSIRNKFELLLIKGEGNLDILLIIELNVDQSFPHSQFISAEVIFK